MEVRGKEKGGAQQEVEHEQTEASKTEGGGNTERACREGGSSSFKSNTEHLISIQDGLLQVGSNIQH